MESKQINACLFASDAQLHFVRVSLYSFLEKNRWFNGTIFLLVHPDFPIASSNLKKLKVIYPEISVIEIERNSNFLNTAKRNKETYLSQVAEYSKIYAFSLNKLNLLYFSNTCLFTKDITDILLPKKISITPEKSIIYIDTKTTASSIFSNAYSQNINMFIDNHSKLEEWNQVSNIVLNAWEIKDNKFIQLKNRVNSANCIFYNDLILNHNINYQKIKQIWLHKNNEITQTLSSPLKTNNINFEVILPKNEKSPAAKPIKAAASNKINDFELNGNRYLNKKIAMCTICNDLFLPGAMCMISSFLQRNKWFTGDIVVFYSEKYSPLSNSSKSSLLRIDSSIKFVKIKDSAYSKVFNRFSLLFKGTHRERFLPSLFTYEAFELAEKFDQVLFLDADMLILGDLSQIFNLDYNLVVTPDAGEYDLNKSYSSFNGGFLLINNKIKGKITKDQLLKFSENTKNYQLFEQTIMNDYFKGSAKYLNSRYNCLKRCFPDNKFNGFDQKIKVVHYVGSKPWSIPTSSSETKYSKIEKLWKNYYSKIK